MNSKPPSLLPSQAQAVAPQVTALVDDLFCNPRSSRYGPYTRIDEGIELLPDRLYRFKMLDQSQQSVSLQVFTGLESIGGQLWEQEVRVLLRVSAVGHPSLPRILNGGYDEENDQDVKIAFVVTERSQFDLTQPAAMPYFQSRPSDCMRHLSLLADALSVLHGQGLMHRNFWPGAVEVIEDPPDSNLYRLRLARFEMSALVSSFLLRVHTGDNQGEREIRELFLRQGVRYLAYCPPERLGFLFSDASAGMFESDRSDVYGLGVLAWEWFLGSLPGPLLSGDPVAGPVASPLEWAKAVRDHMRAELTRRRLSPRIVDLLQGMLDPDPRTRMTSSEVVGEITRNYDALVPQN